ncbi:MAG: nucleotidyltransferase domain-containing protein [Crocosphaera sp.]|nr:nucleotidyltransferase domain-containing protein [Crocosphaera sp.]
MNQNILYERLGIKPKQLQEFCRTAKISEFCLFGSILRDDFNADSDIDILVTFDPDVNISFLQFVDLEYQLEDLLKRKVDLLEKTTVEKDFNWIRRQEILNNYQVIYESKSILSA